MNHGHSRPIPMSAILGLALGLALLGACSSQGNVQPEDREILELREDQARRIQAMRRAEEAGARLREDLSKSITQQERLADELARGSVEKRRLEESNQSLMRRVSLEEGRSGKLEDRLAREETARGKALGLLERSIRRLGEIAEALVAPSESEDEAGFAEGSATRALAGVNAWLHEARLALVGATFPDGTGSLPRGAEAPGEDPWLAGTPDFPGGAPTSRASGQLGTTPASSARDGAAPRGVRGTPTTARPSFLADLMRDVKVHFQRTFTGSERWGWKEYEFLGVLLAVLAFLVWLLGAPLRIYYRRERERELHLLRRVVREVEKNEASRPVPVRHLVSARPPSAEGPESPPLILDPSQTEASEEAREEPATVPEPEEASEGRNDEDDPTPILADEIAGALHVLDDETPPRDLRGSAPDESSDAQPTQVLADILEDRSSRGEVDEETASEEDEPRGEASEPPPQERSKAGNTKVLPRLPREEFELTQVVDEDRVEEPSATQSVPEVTLGEFQPTQVVKAGDSQEFTPTQDIPKVAMDEFSSTQAVESHDPEDVRATQSIPGMVLEEFATTSKVGEPPDGEFASTQVIPELTLQDRRETSRTELRPAFGTIRRVIPPVLPKPQVPKAQARKPIATDKELLAELEELMGRKPRNPENAP